MLSDLRVALRSLVKTPGFTLVAVLTLALGVGANTAIFSVIHAVLLHPFAYKDSERILFIGSNQKGQQGNMPVTYPDFQDWRRNSRSFEQLAYVSSHAYTLTRAAEPAVLNGADTSASVWPLLGMQPILGRTFTEDEDRPGATPVVVLSYATWQNRFGGDPQIAGRTLTLDGKPYTVIGVMPPRFKLWAADLWVPVGLDAASDVMHSRVIRMGAWVLGRPNPGVTMSQAEQELNVIAESIAKQHPETNTGIGVKADLLSNTVTGNFRRPLFVLLAAVAAVLLIACANVANLLLARAAGRQREYAIRVALGATRGQLIRQMVLETVPLATLGGVAGVLLGWWGLKAIMLIIPQDAVPAEAQVAVNLPVMALSLAVVTAAMLLFSLFPAFAASRPAVQDALQEGSRGTSAGRSGRLRAALIVTEVTLSVTLLVGAGLLIRSLSHLYFVDPGFDPQHLVVAQIQLPQGRYTSGVKATAFFDDVLTQIKRIPDVKVAAATTNAPFVGGTGIPLLVEGKTYNDLSELTGVQVGMVLGDYFKAQGLRIVRGRTFTTADRAGSEPVIVLNEAAVKQFVPSGEALGKRVMLGIPANLLKPGMLPPGLDTFQWATVVGVVRSTRHFGLQADPPPEVYIPVDQSWTVPFLRTGMTLVIRTADDPLRVVPAVRQMVAEVDRDQPIGRIASMESIIGDSLRPSRFNAILLALFAGIALTLALVGIYGVVAWNVTQRTREFGIRQALGANAREVLRLVVGQGMRLVLIGLVLGLAGALAVARTLQSMVFEIGTFDPWTFAAVSLLLAAVALLACLIPALRATRIDPIVALRAE
jgi:putative ABC transport system permease protein